MGQTKEGALKALATTYERHGRDFFQKIGHEGGKKSCAKGFASDNVGADGLTGRQRARIVGIVGGKKSRRGKVKKDPIDEAERILEEEVARGRN